MSDHHADEPAVILREDPLDKTGRFRLGRVTLNREKSLNALGKDMIDILLHQLPIWAKDPTIVAVWLEGAGDKAFCAGGNIVQVYESMKTHGDAENPAAIDYFSHEYRLDYMIHTYPKALVCWGNGIVMGGGLGLMAGAGFRVVTEHTRMAMPEVTISLFPDVGASWFLNRLPGHTGRFLGLTAAQINGPDALFAGLADRYISHDLRDDVIDACREADWQEDMAQDRLILDRILREFEGHSRAASPPPESNLRRHLDRINELTDQPTLVETFNAITGVEEDDPWLQKAARTLKQGSPTAVHVIDRQLRRARHWSLADTFRHELVLATNCCRLGEFQEGVRALLIDKDKQPQWRFPDIESVDPAFVDAHFEEHWHQNPLANLD